MPKRGLMGCSFPLIIGVSVVFLVLSIVSFLATPIGINIVGDLGLPDWIPVPRPAPELPAEVVFHLFGFPITNSIIGAWITIIVTVVFSFAVTRRLKIIPGRVQSLFEFAIQALLNFCQSVAGEKNGRRFFPVVATIFFFVIFNAWLSLIPGFGSIEFINAEREHIHLLRGANTDINVPLALALMSFVFVEYFGLRTLGFRYLGKFFNMGRFFVGLGQLVRGRLKAGVGGVIIGAIDIFVGILELMSEFIRILSFTFRLFGNMTAGEILLLVAAFLVPWVVGLPFYLLELLVGLIQALIFAGLTLVFLTLAVAHHGSKEH